MSLLSLQLVTQSLSERGQGTGTGGQGVWWRELGYTIKGPVRKLGAIWKVIERQRPETEWGCFRILFPKKGNQTNEQALDEQVPQVCLTENQTPTAPPEPRTCWALSRGLEDGALPRPVPHT